MNSKWITFNEVLVAIGTLLFALFLIYFATHGPRVHPIDPETSFIEGDAAAGRQSIQRYGCGGCHVIPGIATATGRVGPKLEDIRRQMFIAGVLPNTPDNMIRWIKNPDHYAENTAMPDLDVTHQDAQDIAAYLYQMD